MEGEFGQDFAQLAYWAYNIMVQKTLPIELWLEYEKEGNCDFRLVIRKMWSGSVDDFFEEVIVSEKTWSKHFLWIVETETTFSRYLLKQEVVELSN